MKAFTKDMMKEIEAAADKSGVCSFSSMMENAGAAAVRLLRKNFDVKNKKIVIVAGEGNNGGDGFVCARLLHELEAVVTVILSGKEPKTALAAEAYAKIPVKVYKLRFSEDKKNAADIMLCADFLIDALFGFGFHGAVSGECEEIIKIMGRCPGKKISLDIPSGAVCDSGEISGECVKADYTVSFTALKPAHLLYPAKEKCGEIVTAPVGIPSEMIEQYEKGVEIFEKADLINVMKPRNPVSHKGDYGKLLVICGNYGMAGAAVMSIKAALRCGVGLVCAAVPESIYPIVSAAVPEAVFAIYKENDLGTVREKIKTYDADAVLIGCGLGTGECALSLLKETLENAKCPVIIDADGINLLSEHIDLLKLKKNRVILTPHPKEMSRLIKRSVAEIQSDRINTAVFAANSLKTDIVLKGSGTVIALQNGKLYLNLSGNAGMAKGGSGDVLAGMISAFEARKINNFSAIPAAVYIHGAAGDICARKYSQTAMLPTDIINELPQVFLEAER